MKITLANKKLTQKPLSNVDKAKYFKDIQFKTGNFRPEDFTTIISNGYTITYLYADTEFVRDNSYMKNNYIGTQYIVVDVDKCDIKPQDFVESIKYKPTYIHTTFSNLTAQKDFKYCFHLIYCFDTIIEGEDNFNKVFNLLTSDYSEYIDNNAKDCHRVIFTSNSTLDNFEIYHNDIIYNVKDFLNNTQTEEFDNIDTFFNSNDNCLKNDSSNKSTLSNNLSENSKNRQNQNEDRKPIKNTFELDSAFFDDLNSLDRGTFISKYSIEYPYITETIVPEHLYINGYADLRSEDYYIVPSAQYRWDSVNNKAVIDKVKNGFRNTMLFLDAIAFMKIIPNITKEYLVYLLITEVYKNFINADNQLNNYFIVNKAKEVWNNIDNFDLKPIKKSFKIDKGYWLQRGYNNWLEVVNIIKKDMKSNDFGSLYDFNKTVEDNIKEFKEYGIKTTKKTLIKWLDSNNFEYVTKKDFRDKTIIYYYTEDSNRSSREISQLCKQDGVNVKKDTVIKVINEYRILSKN